MGLYSFLLLLSYLLYGPDNSFTLLLLSETVPFCLAAPFLTDALLDEGMFDRPYKIRLIRHAVPTYPFFPHV